MSVSETLLAGRGNCFWAISMPNLSRLSFLNMLLSYPDIIKNEVSIEIYPLDRIGITIFPMMLIVSLINQRKSVFLSIGKIFNKESLSFNSWRTFRFKKLTELAESTGIFKFTIASLPNPILTSFLVSKTVSL